ncbi:hypothetical protein KWL52_006480 [Clostridioides difficile]|uniref:hypothetical protein n=1 Tax=Clostridioides difficile TaxID=1496 RepID=UPI00159EB98B|nr:hypothetical protein [Clostridioides difficile]MBZ1159185.1 hypothetical protein [Clostridioides difficile]MBZ4494511.1 hypothetical protein [Clostridioides difficile]MCI9976542.1 hypothetical protein [Clostridioides difficile]MCL0943136.1 hypothetical protein [Clostridioides difficile]MCM4101088.1 hypothetical protein [Clostridioides difficile]
MDCKFKQMCKNRYTDCDGCCYNPSAYLEDSFEWNGEGKEPTEEELDDAIK